MTPWLIVAAVWAISFGVVLWLVARMTPGRIVYEAVDKWEPRPRARFHVEVDEGMEDVAAEQFLRADLIMAERGE